MLRCPYCLVKIEPVMKTGLNVCAYICPKCQNEIPRDFVENRKIPQTVVGLVGFSGHGKTVYITSLFYLLQALQNKWKDYFCRGLDDHTIKNFYTRIPLFQEGHLPASTPVNFPDPSLFYFYHIPYLGERFISFYDTAGEVFEDGHKIPEQGQFVAHADVILFITSITNSGDQWPNELERLLDIYLHSVYDRMHIDLKIRQHLILVLSKAELLMEDRQGKRLSDDLVEFLMNGSYQWYLDGNLPGKKMGRNVLKELKSKSRAIQSWMEERGCSGLVKKAKTHFKSVEYTLVSSTGSDPVGDMLVAKLNLEDPKRVLDPFFLILDKTYPRGLLRRLWKHLARL